jgi:phosphoglycolate phosphatase
MTTPQRHARIDAVSFDLDGTLVDTAAEIVLAVNAALAEVGIAARPAEEVVKLIGNGLRALMMNLLARLMLEQPALADRVRVEPLLLRLEALYAGLAGRTAQPYPGALQALIDLRAAGIRTACVTNKDGAFTRRLLDATGLAPLLDLVLAGDSLPHKKPHASVLRTAARQLGVETDRLAHVGDSRTDLEAARNAGVADWAVPYGYNGGRPVAQDGPSRLFDDLAQVACHVLAAHPTTPASA